MRELLILRHADASAAEPGQPDIERPLSARGRAQMAALGPVLAPLLGGDIDIVASAATRTAETARLLAAALGTSAERLVLERDLYDASAGSLLTRVQALDATCTRVALVAHNPGVSVLAHSLVTARVAGFATAGWALLHVPDPWASLAPGVAALHHSG
ncbi:MAG: histidine phosphatase family protein [Pseudomonadota bacterium]